MKHCASGFRPAAFGSFAIFRAPADAPIPVGSHTQADSSDGRRTFGSDRTVRWYDQKQRNEINVFYSRYPAEMNVDDDCVLKYDPFSLPSPGQL